VLPVRPGSGGVATDALGRLPTTPGGVPVINGVLVTPRGKPLVVSVGTQRGYIQHADGSITILKDTPVAKDAQVLLRGRPLSHCRQIF
jgi:hypothetical protein